MIRLIAAVYDMKKEMEKNHVGAYAAQSAYFIMLSLLPLIIMLLSVVQFTDIGKADIFGLIRDFVPVGFQSWLISIVNEMYSHTMAAVSLSALVTAWSAGKSFMALNRGMNSICGVEKRPNYVLMRIRGAVFALIFVILIVLSMVLVVFGHSIHELISRYFPFLAIFTRILLSFRMVLLLAVLIVFFAVLYQHLPNRKAEFAEQLPGAIFSSVAWYLFSFGFSIYIEYRSGAFDMYGSLTTIVLFMFWLYFVMYIVLIGMELNHWISVQRQNLL